MEASASIPTQLASCVAAGRFNPAILTPAWIVKEGILPDGEVEISGLTSTGVGVLQFRMSGYIWQPSLSKLEVYAESDDADPGSFLASVLEKLPHTPIRGVGNNFAASFEGSLRAGLYPLVRCALTEVLVTPEHENVAQSAILALSHEKNAIARLTFEVEQREVVSLGFNFHRDCASAAAGVEAARRWGSDLEEARRLIATLIEYARNPTNGNRHRTE